MYGIASAISVVDQKTAVRGPVTVRVPTHPAMRTNGTMKTSAAFSSYASRLSPRIARSGSSGIVGMRLYSWEVDR